jgi:transmembrane sensor
MFRINQQSRSNVAQQAAQWYLENRSSAAGKEGRIAFMEWLRLSPLHVEEYLKVAGLAQNLRAALDDSQFDIDRLLAEAQAQPVDNVSALPIRTTVVKKQITSWFNHRPLWAGATVAALLFVTATLWLVRDGERFGLPQDFETAHGEQRSWRLPDGSAVNLNSDSEVTVHYDAQERVVIVKRGQALFQVAHETRRRFRVVAGDAEVIAVGTQFDVFRQADATVVTVVDGKVAVFNGAAPPATSVAAIPADALRIVAGEQVRLGGDLKAPEVLVANIRETVAWVQRQIVFEQRPLYEVTKEFNRYGRVPIEINSDSLRSLPITGVFNAYDTESFVAFLERLDGVSVSSVNGRIEVSRHIDGQPDAQIRSN